MHVLASHIRGLPIISLQSGDAIAHVRNLVIDMAKLEVVAFECGVPRQHRPLAILTSDIRQLSNSYLVVESDDELIDPAEIIRLAGPLKTHFDPVGKPVVSELGRQLGRVEDYTVELEGDRIQKLHVRPSGLRSWFGPAVMIDRAQVIDVTIRHIIVRDTTIAAPALPPEALSNSPN